MKKRLLLMGIIVTSLSLTACVSRNLGTEETGGEKRKTTDIIDDAKGVVEDINEKNEKIKPERE